MASTARLLTGKGAEKFNPLRPHNDREDEKENTKPAAPDSASTATAVSKIGRYVPPPRQRESALLSQQGVLQNSQRRTLAELDHNQGTAYRSTVDKVRKSSVVFQGAAPTSGLQSSLRAGNWNEHKLENTKLSIALNPATKTKQQVSASIHSRHAKEPVTVTVGSKGVRATTLDTSEQLPGARTKSGIRFRDQNVGNVFWHWETYPIPAGHSPDKNKGEVFDHIDSLGRTHVRKGRYFVVVRRTRWHVYEVPFYTKGGNGLANTNKKDKCHFMTLVPLHKTEADTPDQVGSGEYIHLEYLSEGCNLGKDRTVLRWDATRVRDVACDELWRAGELQSKSKKLLIDKLNSGIFGQEPEPQDELTHL